MLEGETARAAGQNFIFEKLKAVGFHHERGFDAGNLHSQANSDPQGRDYFP